MFFNCPKPPFQIQKTTSHFSLFLSHSMKNLETRLNLRLFNRTTRNVSLTEAGQQFFEQLLPLYQAINQEVDALNDFLNTPSGLIRINAPAMAAEAVLYPKLKPILNQYPKTRLEIVVDDRWQIL
ncbi:LysR family transcriptional regulator [Pasteurella multocida]